MHICMFYSKPCFVYPNCHFLGIILHVCFKCNFIAKRVLTVFCVHVNVHLPCGQELLVLGVQSLPTCSIVNWCGLMRYVTTCLYTSHASLDPLLGLNPSSVTSQSVRGDFPLPLSASCDCLSPAPWPGVHWECLSHECVTSVYLPACLSCSPSLSVSPAPRSRGEPIHSSCSD